MAKGVFITKVEPTYDDLPEERYQFPATYLKQAEQCVGDWILYYEPRRGGGRLAYFATARVESIAPDPKQSGQYYAKIIDYMEFPEHVPFRVNGKYLESRLQKEDGSVNKGLFGRAIHLLDELEYEAIVKIGMVSNVLRLDTEQIYSDIAAEPEATYARRFKSTVVTRPIRDAAFQALVRNAYDATCAFTGLRIVNGGGRCEIEAAHIKPVEKSGPDSPRNGVALSRTAHWMFDRGILSMEDNGRILVAKKLASEPALRLLNPNGFAAFPSNKNIAPHPIFLKFHRENVFKG